MKKYWPAILTSGVLFFLSLVYRLYGLKNSGPFWVDEFAAADQAKLFLTYGLDVFNQKLIYVEHHNLTTHLLIMASFKLFGVHEWSARLPFAIIGSTVSLLIFFFTKKIFGRATAICAAIFYATSYFAITWSRQARGYTLLQACVLITLILLEKLSSSNKKNFGRYSIALAAVIVIGFLTHSMYYLFFLVAIIIYSLNNRQIFSTLRKPLFFAAFLILIIPLVLLKVPTALASFIAERNLVNNLWYYHSFLWREYGMITLLAIFGWIMALKINRTAVKAMVIYIIVHLFFLCFLFAPYVSRYLLPVMPFFYIGMAYALVKIAGVLTTQATDGFAKTTRNTIAFVITMFIILNGNLFTIKPKKYYSVNHIFREIALVDYDQVYDPIKKKIGEKKEKPAVIETWPARASWYIGRNYGPTYLVRWNDNGFTNGISRHTEYYVDKNGDKILKGSNEPLVLNLADLKKIISRHQSGFIFIDDATLPKEIIDYAETNLKKELWLDHYTLDDNPYSLWPATLYSWDHK